MLHPRGRFTAEVTKLRRPVIVASLTAVLIVIVLQVFAYQRAADERYRSLTMPGSTCAGRTERTCFPLVELRADFPAVGLQRHPVALGGVAAGFVASLPGAITLMIFSAAFVAGEWERGTVAVVLARSPDRASYTMTKYAVLATIGIALLLVVWLALLLVVPVLNTLHQPQSIPPTFDVVRFSLMQLMRAAFVIGAYAGIGTASGMLIRSPLGSLGATITFIAVGIGLSRIWPVSFGYWIAQWMGFNRDAFGGTHLWPVHAAGAGGVQSAIPVLGLAGCMSLPFAAIAVLRRSEV
jgi:hypothetical protein